MIEFIDLLRKSDLFSSLEEHELTDLAAKFEFISLREGEILFSRGEKSDYIYIVISGHISSYLINKDNLIQTIGTIGQGQILGEAGVLSDEPRMLTVRATVTTRLARLPAEQFNALCANKPVVLQKTTKTVITRSQLTMNLIADDTTQWHIIVPVNSHMANQPFITKLKKNLIDFPGIYFKDTDDIFVIKKIIENNHIKKNKVILFIHSTEILKELVDLIRVKSIYLLADNHCDFYIDPKILNFISNETCKMYFKSELILLHGDHVKTPTNTIQWLKKLHYPFHYHIKQNQDEDYKRFLRFINGSAIVLVLGGGGAKGWFHVGLIKALRDNNIEIDAIGGVSAGSIVGASFLFDTEFDGIVKNLERLTEVFYKISKLSNLTWPLISFFNPSESFNALQQMFQKARIEDFWRPFFCVTANLSVCNESAHFHGELASLLMASNSLPGVLPPFIIDGQLHYDGGLINNLPVDVMRNRVGNRNKIIASRLSTNGPDNTRYDFPHKVSFFDFLKSRINKKYEKSYPPVWDSFLKGLLLGSLLKERENCEYADHVLNPDLSKFSIYYLSKEQEKKLLEFGYQEGLSLINSEGRIDHDRA